MLSSLKELFEYKDLLLTLALKELKVRYKNSILGFLWSMLNPILMMLIFTFVFSLIAKFGIKDFPLFLLIGLLPWNFFNLALAGATGSVVANGGLVKKVYFPREILPISVVVAELLNFLIAMGMLLVFLAIRGYPFLTYLPLVLLVVVIQTLMTIGLSLLLAGMNVYFRDIQYILGIVLLFMFYATPIIYPMSLVENSTLAKTHAWLLPLYKLNPVTPLVIMYKSLLYEHVLPNWQYFAYALGWAAVLLVAGSLVFRKLAPKFAEEM